MPELPLFTVASAIGNCGPSTSASSDSVYVERWIVRPRWGKLPLATNPHRRVHLFQALSFTPQKKAVSFFEKKEIFYRKQIFFNPPGLFGYPPTKPPLPQEHNQTLPE